MKLFHVTTVPSTLNFLDAQIAFAKDRGFEVHAVSSPGPDRAGIPVHSIPMTRSIDPISDLRALWSFIRLFQIHKPAIVHGHTPKAALLSMLAARIAGVPRRIFHIHGLPHTTATGFSRIALMASTRIAAACATRILAVSASVAAECAAQGLCGKRAIHVPALGGIAGVDALGAFAPDEARREQARVAFDLPADALAIGFAGRLVLDKGVQELWATWQVLRREFPNLYLVVAGEAERRDGVPHAILDDLLTDDRVRMLGQFGDMPAFYSAIDVLALPTYREGLPTVILEAAAMGKPCVASRCTGCVDAVSDGVTGTLVSVGDVNGLVSAMAKYLNSPELCESHGTAARVRMLKDFRPEQSCQPVYEEYCRSAQPRVPRQGLDGKRVVDVLLSAAVLLLVSPALAIVAVLVRIGLGSPVLFRQSRPGRDEKLFTMLKFRTMRNACGRDGKPLPDSERLTPLGRFLRATSLDELPELWNVLKGDMSLVGPRPLLPAYLDRYTQFQRRRHAMKPGITGLAQVNGRNAVSWDERFALDVWYVDHATLRLDLKILLRTVWTVLRRDGIAQQGHATIAEFMGNVESA